MRKMSARELYERTVYRLREEGFDPQPIPGRYGALRVEIANSPVWLVIRTSHPRKEMLDEYKALSPVLLIKNEHSLEQVLLVLTFVDEGGDSRALAETSKALFRLVPNV